MQPETQSLLQLDVAKVYGDFELNVTTSVALSGVTGLFGPSGSGKSTLLRIIAGFEKDVSGSVRTPDEVWQDSHSRLYVPAFRREVGYVFQNARLFTHLDVSGNLRYASDRSSGVGPEWDDVVSALDLAPLLQRSVAGLSGGECQRVALARTLLSKPRLLLLDEPLAALDSARKHEILPYLEALPGRFAIPAIYVSHSVDEIVRLAERVLVLRAGKVHAQGNTVDVLNSLESENEFAAADSATVLEARVHKQLPDLHLTELLFEQQSLFVPALPSHQLGQRVLLRVHANDVALATSSPRNCSVRNVLAGQLAQIQEFPGSPFALASVDIGGVTLRARLTRHAVHELKLTAGAQVYALLKTATLADRDL